MKYLFPLLFSSLVMVSCQSDSNTPTPDEPAAVSSISIDKPTAAISALGGDIVINVTANSEWKLSGGNDWCRTDISQGSGDRIVMVAVSPNTAYDTRKVSLTFETTGVPTKAASVNIIITQAEAGGLFIGTDDTTLVRQGGVVDVQLLSNVDYDIVIERPDWIAVDATKTLIPSSKRFVVSANETTEPRSSKVIFKDKSSVVADTLIIAQNPTGESQNVVTHLWDGVRRADIFYQIFVRSFADSDGDGIGDLNGVTAKLDYIESLGCTGIWLTPINPSPSYHGYDVTDYEAVNPQFGTMADFDALVAAANARGIKVVLDFVINHTSNQHPWFMKGAADKTAAERGYYLFEEADNVQQRCESGAIPMIEDKKYNSSMWRYVPTDSKTKYYAMFDGSMPDINYGVLPNLNPVYDKILHAAKFWLAKGAAGLRLDAVKHIYQDENSPQNWQFLNRFYTDVKAAYPNVYMVGEVLSGVDMTAKYFAGLPSLFHFDSWWKLDWSFSNATGRYYAQEMSSAIAKFRANRSDFNACTKLSNHDEDRAMSKMGGSIDKAKIACAAIMTTPGQPYIYYGEELGMSGMKSSGDENVREPMPWGDNYTTTWTQLKNNKTLPNVVTQKANNESLLSFYLELTKLRNSFPALVDGDLTYPDPAKTPQELMVFERATSQQKIMVVINVSDKTVDYEFSGKQIEALRKAHAGAELLKLIHQNDSWIAEMKPFSALIIELK